MLQVFGFSLRSPFIGQFNVVLAVLKIRVLVSRTKVISILVCLVSKSITLPVKIVHDWDELYH